MPLDAPVMRIVLVIVIVIVLLSYALGHNGKAWSFVYCLAIAP
jgi:uncharacterized membrane protein YciS (DUF1049 family)